MRKKNLKKYIFFILFLFFTNIHQIVYSQSSDDLYEKIDLLSEVLEKIEKEYVEEINQSETIDAGSSHESELIEALVEFSYQRGVLAGTLYGYFVCFIAGCAGYMVFSVLF